MATKAYRCGARVVVDNPESFAHGEHGEVVLIDDLRAPHHFGVMFDKWPDRAPGWFVAARLRPEQATTNKGTT